MCCTYVFSTCVTVLCVERLKAVAAVWSSILHDVALATEGGLTLVATEVLHVPVPALCLGAFISKDYLHDPDITFISTDRSCKTTNEFETGFKLVLHLFAQVICDFSFKEAKSPWVWVMSGLHKDSILSPS